jgi:hypothetical protein
MLTSVLLKGMFPVLQHLSCLTARTPHPLVLLGRTAQSSPDRSVPLPVRPLLWRVAPFFHYSVARDTLFWYTLALNVGELRDLVMRRPCPPVSPWSCSCL